MLKNKNSGSTDTEARNALWGGIREAANRLSDRCTIYISRTPDEGSIIGRTVHVPDLQTWRLVEALSLLMILIKADRVYCTEIINLFGRAGPLHFAEEGRDRYLWAQTLLFGQESELAGRPDLIVSSSQEAPSSKTILRVVECKCRQHLGAHEIRAEFGKAVDLKVTSYLIWSFTTPNPRIVKGAERLGLDLVALGFDTARRADLIARPENLAAHVGNSLEAARREERFARTLNEIGGSAARKMLR